MHLTSIYYLAAGAVWKRRPFGSMLFRLGGGQRVRLNTTATQLLAQLNGRCSVADIAAAQATRCHISLERATADVTQLFDRLLAGRWLTEDPACGQVSNETEVAPPLDQVSLALTHRCNLRCRYCYIPLTDHATGELTTQEWLDVVQQLKPFKLMCAILTGGEPLLRSDLWDIIAALNAINVSAIIVTNGTLIDQEFVTRARQAELASIQFALDGSSAAIHDSLRGAGTFEQAWRGIQLVQQAGLNVDVQCTVTRATLPDYLNVVRLARQHHLPVGLNEYLPLGPGRAQRDELELTTPQLFQLRSKIATLSLSGVLPCQADETNTFARRASSDPAKATATWPCVSSCLGRDSGAHVLPDGDVLICPLLDWPQCVGGNVRQQPLRDIWEHSPVFEQLRHMTVDDYATCRTCANRQLCGGTCRALTMAQTQSLVGRPDLARCFWEQIYYARVNRVMFDSTAPLQTVLEREGLLR